MPNPDSSYLSLLEGDRTDPVPCRRDCINCLQLGKDRRISSGTDALCWLYLTQYRTLTFLGEADSPWETLIQELWVLLKIPDNKTGWFPSPNQSYLKSVSARLPHALTLVESMSCVRTLSNYLQD